MGILVDSRFPIEQGCSMSKPEDNLANVIQTLAETIHQLTVERRNEFEWFKAHLHLATKQDLEKMEARLIAAMTGNATVSASLEDAALRVQSALDALDATIPD
jgi:hypothetical protein